MKTFILLTTLLFCAIQTFAQVDKTRPGDVGPAKNATDSERFKFYMDKGFNYMVAADFSNSYNCYDEAELIAKKHKDKLLVGLVLAY